MKSPITGKEMSQVAREATVTFRKEEFTVIYPCYFDADSDEYFTTTEFDTIKMKQVYNKYRDKHNIPFPEEIVHTRKKYDLSAKKMSEILGFGTNGYRQYENGEVPSQSNANLIQLSGDPSQFKKLVERNLNAKQADPNQDLKKSEKKLLQRIDELIEQEEKNRPIKNVKNYLLGSSLPDMYSGYTKPNLEKLTEMVVYFSEAMQPTITKLNKLLFYSDFLRYKNTAHSISGTRYRAIDHGPVPNNYDSIYEFMETSKAIRIIMTELDWGYKKEFEALRSFNKSLFEDEELEILKKVELKFKSLNASELSQISHDEKAWISSYKNDKDLIDYSEAINLNVTI